MAVSGLLALFLQWKQPLKKNCLLLLQWWFVRLVKVLKRGRKTNRIEQIKNAWANYTFANTKVFVMWSNGGNSLNISGILYFWVVMAVNIELR